MVHSTSLFVLFVAACNFMQNQNVQAFSLTKLSGRLSQSQSLSNTRTSSHTTILHDTRRSFLNEIVSTATSTTATTAALIFSTAITTTTATGGIQPAFAAEEPQGGNGGAQKTVQTPLYYILRVREATEQETRLIKSGKFKDVQRANVKLAVKFMVDNYRLNDNFIAASAFLTGDRRIKAGDIGQSVVQNLYTILEYFDASDVENIKVGSTGLGGKEVIVLNGLQAARKGIDDFVGLFPKEDVMAVIAKIEEENAVNEKEFDKELNQGSGILNPKPSTVSP